jgi:hypothetical protein
VEPGETTAVAGFVFYVVHAASTQSRRSGLPRAVSHVLRYKSSTFVKKSDVR